MLDPTLGQDYKALYIYSESWAMEVWLFAESISVCKSTLRKDHMRIISCVKSGKQDYIILKHIIALCLS